MSNAGGRGEQIVARLFVKSALLVSDARLTNREVVASGAQARLDKWFQLEVRDDGAFGNLAQEIKEMAAEPGTAPVELRVRTVLVLPHLAAPAAQALVLLSESNPPRRARVDMPASARGILLEEWCIALDRAKDSTLQAEDPYPGIYKQAIALMRSLFALLRYFPTWQLHRKLNSGAPMQITVGTSMVSEPLDEDILGFEHKLVPDDTGPSTFSFPPISTPLGSITFRVHYRAQVRFRLDPLENLWSSAFASGPPSPGTQAAVQRLGAGSTSPASPSPPTPAVNPDQLAFTPTLLATRQRQSLTGSGSPLRPSSRPGTGPSTTPTLGTGLPPIRPRTVSQLSAGGEPGSPRRAVYDLARSPPGSPRPVTIDEGGSGLSRTRTQSLLSAAAGRGGLFAATGGTSPGALLGATGETPPSPGPGARRPSGINPFKSGTLGSSPRIGTGIGSSPRTTPGLGIGTGTSPRSALGVGTATGSEGRRSLESGTGDTAGGAQPQPIKRYDTSFGHRAARSHGSVGSGSAGPGGAGSAGTGGGILGSVGTGGLSGGGGSIGGASAGSGGTGEPHRRLTTIGSQSYESQLAEDEGIGQFIKDIDTRPQLGLDVSGSGASMEGTGTERFPLSSPIQERLPLGSPRPGPALLTASPRPGALPLGSSPRVAAGSPRPSLLVGSPRLSHRRMSSMDSEPARAERFPPSSLPTRYSALPDVMSRPSAMMSPLSPDAPRPLPPPLQSVPPSPAESAWPSRFRDRSRSRDRTSGSRTRGFGEPALAPLPERDLADRARTLSLADRTGSLGLTDRAGSLGLADRTGSLGLADRTGSLGLADRTGSLGLAERTESLGIRERALSTYERERTLSFGHRRMLTNRDDVDAALQLMRASFQASYAPPSPTGTGTPLAESGRRQIGNDEIVGRLELGGSGSTGVNSVRGSMRPGRDTDTWRDGGEWDSRRGGWC